MPKKNKNKGEAIVVEAKLVSNDKRQEQLIQAQENIRDATEALQLAYRTKAELYMRMGRDEDAITQLTKAGKVRDILRGL